MEHDLFAIAFTTHGGNDSANRNLLHVGTSRTYTSQSYNLVGYCQPQVNGCLIISVQILINAVLFNHEYLATHSK